MGHATGWLARLTALGSLLQYDSHGCNFLHNAIQEEDVESVMFLLSVHVDVNSKVRNHSVHTPLHLAIKKGSELLVRHLVSPQTRAGADVLSPHSRAASLLSCWPGPR